MDDLTPFELEQIARLESKCIDARHKSSQSTQRSEDKFKEVALAITQLYTIIGIVILINTKVFSIYKTLIS